MAKKKKQENKKNNLKKIEKSGSFDTDIWSKFFIVLGILCFLCAFYLLTLYITNKNSTDTTEKDKESGEVNISYDEIMVGRTFDMSDGDYLVLYYDMDDENISSIYSGLVSDYKNKEEHLNIYTVDMSSPFNKPYVTDKESNKNPGKASEILVNGPTLIKVSNKQVSDYIEGEEAITNYLK